MKNALQANIASSNLCQLNRWCSEPTPCSQQLLPGSLSTLSAYAASAALIWWNNSSFLGFRSGCSSSNTRLPSAWNASAVLNRTCKLTEPETSTIYNCKQTTEPPSGVAVSLSSAPHLWGMKAPCLPQVLPKDHHGRWRPWLGVDENPPVKNYILLAKNPLIIPIPGQGSWKKKFLGKRLKLKPVGTTTTLHHLSPSNVEYSKII